jgi:hypothetical protein
VSDFYVYVAGPMSGPAPEYLANCANLTVVSRALMDDGLVPINPAADLLEGLVSVRALTVAEYQRRSIALLRLLQGRPGCMLVTRNKHDDGRVSEGVAAEIAEAKRLGIPVLTSIVAVLLLVQRLAGVAP